jgi:zinc/manganese transport system substrate-binding protein
MTTRIITFLSSFVFLFLIAFRAEAKLKIVTTTPDFASIAREIGGDRVEVSSLAKGVQDPHFVDAKPSFIRLLNQADVLIEGGIELEIGWLPPLLENARNGKIQTGSPGRIVASTGVNILQIPTRPVERSQGDVHPLGNPHYMLDPENGKIVGEEIASTLCRLDAGSCDRYRQNQTAFNQHLDRKIADWTKAMAPYRGAKVITYHDSWPYFAERFGLNVVGHIEPKPGVPPSTAHLKQLIETASHEKVKAIIMEPFYNEQAPKFVAAQTGAKVVVLPPSVATEMGMNDYFQLFDHLIETLTVALK